MVATLNSLSEENHTARTERAEDRATLQSIAATLKTLQDQLADTSQQQRAQNLALLRLEGKGTPQLGGTGFLRPPDAPCRHPTPGPRPIQGIGLRASTRLIFPSLTGPAIHGRG